MDIVVDIVVVDIVVAVVVDDDCSMHLPPPLAAIDNVFSGYWDVPIEPFDLSHCSSKPPPLQYNTLPIHHLNCLATCWGDCFGYQILSTKHCC